MRRSTYYVECPFCRCNLDPGERCDCQGAQKALRDVLPVKVKKVSVRGEKPLRRDVRAS